ncbi:MAG: exodeoxyribonuclease VII small subunit [Actinobacteria bacterium]|mgnify:FL=1|nr:exodeoxyribonuclease VII small subunit [Actinomycetota bacterium]MCB8997357.1 exodeoxyribonuclease VII small subunit [Actinomycetota bacterium]MCB9414145.1 exodeoxyribonuclease VII small subunit [Actinomycetota bacterium]MCB9423664.1 exodeoxyribonuclease VII small subunit [Actinomycetota bacterium]HRY10725.1 exodeoxyribonuclease VII small subunit [Candidatus Nanopelagicales bacterium]
MAEEQGLGETLTFEAAREELELIVRRLEDGSVTLQESVELWERGEKLAAHCDVLLGQVESRIEAAKAQVEEPT